MFCVVIRRRKQRKAKDEEDVDMGHVEAKEGYVGINQVNGGM